MTRFKKNIHLYTYLQLQFITKTTLKISMSLGNLSTYKVTLRSYHTNFDEK